jgi:ribonucleoside-diphosphate reductase alpha chain
MYETRKKEADMKITRLYSTADRPVAEQIQWKTVEASNPGAGFRMTVEVPEGWSQDATNVFAQRYLRKAGVSESMHRPGDYDGMPYWLIPHKPEWNAKFGAETSAKQVFHRLAGCWTYWGWKEGYFGKRIKDEVDARIFYDELYTMLALQIAAPNSPQWFSTGIHWAYGIEGDASGQWVTDANGNAHQTSNSYERPQPSACFIQPVDDNLVDEGGIFDLLTKEARIFKFGSGTGTNFSAIRAKGEALRGGGVSSGLMSFLEVLDRGAGSIKSGGVCLTSDTPIMTENGFVRVIDLAESKDQFIVFSLEKGKIRPKRASAFFSGIKECVRITTDKGIFEVSYDHPFLTKTGKYRPAATLSIGDRLSQTRFFVWKGYPALQHHDEGKLALHRVIASEFVGDITNKIVHHRDENVYNIDPRNLQIYDSNSEHAIDHANNPKRKELQRKIGRRVAQKLLAAKKHPFQLQNWGKFGSENPMYRDGDFWKSENSVAYRLKKREELIQRGTASEMQNLAATSQMLNFAYKLIERGYDVSSFDGYIRARKREFSLGGNSKRKLLQMIEDRFGSYEEFYAELGRRNHEVLDVELIGLFPVYDVQVRCSSPEDRSEKDFHNFAIGSLGSSGYEGYATFVHNTRRAAKMVVLDLDHPEIEDFVRWKVREETKAAAMHVGSKFIRENAWSSTPDMGIPQAIIDRTENGFPAEVCSIGWEGEAISTVSGQNSNNSVRVTDEFLRAVDDDAEWNLTARTTGETVKTIRARDLWDLICRSAWASADPGVQFHDTMNAWHTCSADGRINASNPCSEYLFLDNTACNLASINLVKFKKPDGSIDLVAFEHAVRLWTIVLDISVSMASYPSREIAMGSYNYRTLGLGYANAGGLLMRLGLPYDSDEGRALIAGLTALMTGISYRTSAEIADALGPFPRWEANAEGMRRVLRNHARTSLIDPEFIYENNIDYSMSYEDLNVSPYWLDRDLVSRYDGLYIAIAHAWRKVLKAQSFRNAQTTLIAPTGTISLIMDCETSGIEPDFALVKTKMLAGGGEMRMVNSAVPEALRALDYTEMEIDNIADHIRTTGTVELCPYLKMKHFKVFDCAVSPLPGGRTIDPMAHVRMVAAVQPFLSGGVSKTVNLPREATVTDIDRIYREAHRLGCKSVALYRDGSKLTQPLNAASGRDQHDDTSPLKTRISDPESIRLFQEAILESSGVVRSPGTQLRADADPYQADAVLTANVSTAVSTSATGAALAWGARRPLPAIRRGYRHKLRVEGQTVYLATGEYDDGSLGELFVTLSREGTTLRSMMESFAKAISIGLQHGVPLGTFVKAFTNVRFEPAGIVEGHDRIKLCSSLVDLILRSLGLTYLGREDLANVRLESTVASTQAGTVLSVPSVLTDRLTPPSPVMASAITGDLCACGGLLVRTGTCVTCSRCGANTGCG